MKYSPGDGEEELPYWELNDAEDMAELDQMVTESGDREWYNFIVCGTPKRISPEWLAKHPGYKADEYEYCVSYSLPIELLRAMLDEHETPLEAFNWYLENTGKEWVEINTIRLVDRTDPWENTM